MERREEENDFLGRERKEEGRIKERSIEIRGRDRRTRRC